MAGPAYRITEDCVGCGSCLSTCPVKAIKDGEPYLITNKCTGCGDCVEVCPVEAIVASGGDDLG